MCPLVYIYSMSSIYFFLVHAWSTYFVRRTRSLRSYENPKCHWCTPTSASRKASCKGQGLEGNRADDIHSDVVAREHNELPHLTYSAPCRLFGSEVAEPPHPPPITRRKHSHYPAKSSHGAADVKQTEICTNSKFVNVITYFQYNPKYSI